MVANRWQEALDTLTAQPAEVGLFKDKPYPLEQQRALLHRLGRHAQELPVALELTRRFNTPRLQLDLAHTYAALGQADSLRPIAQRVATAAQGQAGSWRTLLRTLTDELRWHGHEAQARTILESLLAGYDSLPKDSLALPAVVRGRAETLARLGRWADAMSAVAPVVSNDTTLATRLSLAVGRAHSGDPAPAAALDAELAALPSDPYRPGVIPYVRARLALARGDRAGAIELLRTAQTRAFPVFDGVHGNFEFESLRSDPAFLALLKPSN